MSYDSYCKNCPYQDQKHLNVQGKTDRKSPPIELEKNNSDILLVFQAPGIHEWEKGKAIQSVKQQGGTAGKRIELSWERMQKHRDDFDIINTVQCFPGKNGDRDLKPSRISICACSGRLENILKNNQYKKIITFGAIAQNAIASLVTKLELNITISESKHPAGGLKNKDLDVLW